VPGSASIFVSPPHLSPTVSPGLDLGGAFPPFGLSTSVTLRDGLPGISFFFRLSYYLFCLTWGRDPLRLCSFLDTACGLSSSFFSLPFPTVLHVPWKFQLRREVTDRSSFLGSLLSTAWMHAGNFFNCESFPIPLLSGTISSAIFSLQT